MRKSVAKIDWNLKPFDVRIHFWAMDLWTNFSICKKYAMLIGWLDCLSAFFVWAYENLEIRWCMFQVKSTESSKTDEQSRIDQLEHEKYMVEIQVSGLKEAIEAAHNDLEDAGVEKRTLEKQVDLIYRSHNIFTYELEEEFHYFEPLGKTIVFLHDYVISDVVLSAKMSYFEFVNTIT